MTRTASSSSSPPPRRHPFRGYCYIAAATLFWGISATLGRAVFTGRLIAAAQSTRPLDPIILAQSRTTLTLLVLAPVLLLLRRHAGLRMPAGDVARCLALGIAGVAASNYFYYLAIQKTNVATAIIIQYTAPAWVLVYMVARRLQRATLPRITAVFLAVVGSALAMGLVGKTRLQLNFIGVMAAFAAAVAFATYNVGGSHMVQRHDRWKVLLYALLGAVSGWLLVNPPWKVVAAHYTGEQWGFLAIFAATSALIPFSLYFSGLEHLDATRAVVTSCLEPVFSIVLAASFLGESVGPLQVVGMAVVIVATIIAQMPERKSRARNAS